MIVVTTGRRPISFLQNPGLRNRPAREALHGPPPDLTCTPRPAKSHPGRDSAGACRDDFDDATNFIRWYVNLSHREAGIPRNDANRQNLAHHEGRGGYLPGTWRDMIWLRRMVPTLRGRTRPATRRMAGGSLNGIEPHIPPAGGLHLARRPRNGTCKPRC